MLCEARERVAHIDHDAEDERFRRWVAQGEVCRNALLDKMLSGDLLRLAQQSWADARPHIAKAPDILGQLELPCRLDSISANKGAHRVERRAVRNRHLRRRGDGRRIEEQKTEQSSSSSHLRPIGSRRAPQRAPAYSQDVTTYVEQSRSSKANGGSNRRFLPVGES